MSERPDRLREALRAWDPSARTPTEQSSSALDGVRNAMRHAATRGEIGRAPWLRLAWAGTAAVALLTLALVLREPSSPARDPDSRAASLHGGPARPVSLTLVASNGVRIYWTVPAAGASDIKRTP